MIAANPTDSPLLRELCVKTHIQPRPAPSLQLAANSHRIRTYPKCARNSFTMNTSRTQHLKSFGMNTYKKKGEGAPSSGTLLLYFMTSCGPHTNACKPFALMGLLTIPVIPEGGGVR